MRQTYIAPEWLQSICKTALFYPAADLDHSEALTAFQDYVRDFWFCDIHYSAGLALQPAVRAVPQIRLVERNTFGPVAAVMERRTDDRGKEYRFLLPSRLNETYQRGDGSTFTVVRRRGFGQIALLTEFAEKTIGVFMHRGDSLGESGSNMWFLANKPKRYEPVANLFDKLATRLCDSALVISDGSNTTIAQLRKFHRKEIDGCNAFEFHRTNTKDFDFGGFRWSCVGWFGRRYGPTLVWGLTRQTV